MTCCVWRKLLVALIQLAIFATMEKVTLDLFGFTLLEPSTYISDMFLTAFSLGLYFSLKKLYPSNRQSILYSRFFLFMGLGTLIGGHAHIFAMYISHYLYHALAWSMASLGLFYLQMGSLYDFDKRFKSILKPLFIAQLVISVAVFFGYQLFGGVEVNHHQVGTPGFDAVKVTQALGYLGFIVPLHLLKFYSEKDNGSAIILMGMVVSLGALLVQSKQWAISKHFNHNDIAHIIMAFVYYLFYWGIRLKVSFNEESANEH
jgi:hypothetical protein